MSDNDEDCNSDGDNTTVYTGPAPSNETSNFTTQNPNIPRSTFGKHMSFSPVNTMVNPRRLTVNTTIRNSVTRPTPLNDFNTIPCSDTEISTFDPIVKKDNMPESDKEFAKIRENATTPLANSCFLLSIEDSDK